jgi:poly(A) polymerase
VLPALAQAVEAGGEEERRRFHAHLVALDQLVRSGDEVSEAVLLGSLLMHLRRGPEGEASSDSLLGALVQTARLPRRMAERTRLALGAQRMFRGPPRRRRRRGGVATQAYFRDALQLLEMTVRATGEGEEALETWKAQAEARLTHPEPAASSPPSGAAPEIAVEAEIPVGVEGPPSATPGGEPGRRRRRRGGRRRRRRGRGQPAAAPAAGGP